MTHSASIIMARLRRIATRYLRYALLAFGLGASSWAVAQRNSSVYRDTVLAIQQQIETNRLEEACVEVNVALKKYPADGGLENLLGIIEIEQGNTDQAKQDFSQAILHNPRLISAYLNLARLQMQSGEIGAANRNQALRLYDSVLRLDPENAEALFESATLLSAAHKYQLSLDRLRRLNEPARQQIGAEALICADEAALGDHQATNRAADAMAANPSLTEQDANSILPALRSAHRADLIDRIFSAANQRKPLSAAGLRIIGLAQEVEGKNQQARVTLESAFELNPSDAAPLIDLTRIALSGKDYQGALGYLLHAREIRPNDASLSYELSLICLKLNLIGEADRAMKQAVKLAPDNPDYELAMGTLETFAEDPFEGMQYLDKYLKMRPGDPAAFLAMGIAYFGERDFIHARVWLQRAAADLSTAAQAHYYLGRILRQEGDLANSLAELTKSNQLKPNQPDVLADMGAVYVQLRDYDKAQQELDHALQLDPDSFSANFELLQLYVKRHDPRRAEQAKKFQAIKGENDQQYRNSMRMLEIRPETAAENQLQQGKDSSH